MYISEIFIAFFEVSRGPCDPKSGTVMAVAVVPHLHGALRTTWQTNKNTKRQLKHRGTSSIRIGLYKQSKRYMQSNTLYEVHRSKIRCMQSKPESSRSTRDRCGDQSSHTVQILVPHMLSHTPSSSTYAWYLCIKYLCIKYLCIKYLCIKYLCMIPVTSQKIPHAPLSLHQYWWARAYISGSTHIRK